MVFACLKKCSIKTYWHFIALKWIKDVGNVSVVCGGIVVLSYHYHQLDDLCFLHSFSVTYQLLSFWALVGSYLLFLTVCATY